MEFEDQEEHEGDVEMGPSYDDDDDDDSVLPNSTRSAKMPPSPVAMDAEPQSQRKPKYRECLKNHAVGIGGHAVDGCGEFMAAGAEGTLDALKCAACNCHRNFHRKEANVGVADHFFHYHHHQQPLLTNYPHRQFSPPYYRAAGPSGYLQVVQPRPLALPSTSGGGGGRDDQDDISGGGSKKRFRTKFTQEQKEKMMDLAERLGWRIQKQDEEVVQQFCNEVGLKRHVLKVWMHNNKHTLGKKP